MSLENTYIGKGIIPGSNFDLSNNKPLDSRLVVKNTIGLTEIINANRAYPGMIVYVESESKHYHYIETNNTYSFAPLYEQLANRIANLENVVDFVGVGTVTTDADGDIQVTIEGVNTFSAGNVVLDKGTGKEYVYDGSSWQPLGDADAFMSAISNLESDLSGHLTAYATYIADKSMSDTALQSYADDAAQAVQDKLDSFSKGWKNSNGCLTYNRSDNSTAISVGSTAISKDGIGISAGVTGGYANFASNRVLLAGQDPNDSTRTLRTQQNKGSITAIATNDDQSSQSCSIHYNGLEIAVDNARKYALTADGLYKYVASSSGTSTRYLLTFPTPVTESESIVIESMITTASTADIQALFN